MKHCLKLFPNKLPRMFTGLSVSRIVCLPVYHSVDILNCIANDERACAFCLVHANLNNNNFRAEFQCQFAYCYLMTENFTSIRYSSSINERIAFNISIWRLKLLKQATVALCHGYTKQNEKKIPLNSLCMSFTFSRPSPIEILDEFDLNSKMFLSTHHLRQAIFHLWMSMCVIE